MIINHNVHAINTHRKFGENQHKIEASFERISSGERINRAADDAAGLAITEKLRGQINGLEMAHKNATDGLSLIQTAEGALHETVDMLQRMRELSVQASNDTNIMDPDREMMQQEIAALLDEIDDHAYRTELNTQKLIDGSFQNKVFQIGANPAQFLEVNIGAMDGKSIGLYDEVTTKVNRYSVQSVTVTKNQPPPIEMPITGLDTLLEEEMKKFNVLLDAGEFAAFQLVDQYFDEAKINGLGLVTGTKVSEKEFDFSAKMDGETFTGVDISTRERAEASIGIIDRALDRVISERSKLGAIENRLQHTMQNITNSIENLTAADSRIRDVDLAREMMEYTKANVLSEVSQSILAQGSKMPGMVLELLR